MTPAELSRTVLSTVRRAVADDELRLPGPAVPATVVVRRPPRPGCGDYATNVALQLAGPADRTPRQVAEILRKRLAAAPGIARVEIAEPGFLNITLDAASYGDVVRVVLRQGAAYGHGDGLRGVRVTLTPRPGHAPEPRAVAHAAAANRLLRACGAAEGLAETVMVRPAGVTAAQLRARLGTDAAHWALLRPPAQDAPHLDPDTHLAQRESNPLFRVQYAHARTRALLRNAHDLGMDLADTAETGDTGEYPHPAGTGLLALIADFPQTVEAAARHRAPDRVARHLERLADAFFRFHDECPLLPRGDEKPSAVHGARLRLADATGTVLANGLHLLGISAPDHL